MSLHEATIALPNGHANGYHPVGFVAETAMPQDVESPATLADVPQAYDSAVSVPKESHSKPTAPEQRQIPAAEAKATSADQPKASSRRGTTKKAKPKDRRIKFVPQAKLDAEQAKLKKLSQAALAGDTEAIDRLRIELDNRPHVWQQLADLQRRVELKLIELVAGNDPLQAQAFRRRCSEFRRQILDGEPASMATKMAAARAVSCWLFCQLLELRTLESHDGLRNIRALEQAERRFQVALRTLHLARQADFQLQRLASQYDGS